MADDGLRARQHDELMPGTEQAGGPPAAPLPVLFLMADTGGGHRNAAQAVGESLELAYPGRFAPVLCDPLGGPGSTRLLRWVTGLYGPVVRLAPWLWSAAYYGTNLRPAIWLLRRTLLRPPTGWQLVWPGRTGPRRSCRSTRSPAWPRSGHGMRLRHWRPW